MVVESHKIIDMGDWWIEYHNETGISTVAGAVMAAVFTLIKPGHFVGCAGGVNGNISNASGPLIVDPGGSRLNYGDALTGIRCQVTNDTGGPLDVGCHVIVILKK